MPERLHVWGCVCGAVRKSAGRVYAGQPARMADVRGLGDSVTDSQLWLCLLPATGRSPVTGGISGIAGEGSV